MSSINIENISLNRNSNEFSSLLKYFGDTTTFIQGLYGYYIHNGYRPLLFRGIASILELSWFFLFVMTIASTAFSGDSLSAAKMGWYLFVSLSFAALASIYCFYFHIRRWRVLYRIVSHEMDLNQYELINTPWDKFLQHLWTSHLIEQNHPSPPQLSSTSSSFAIYITQLLMRLDNYMIALYSSDDFGGLLPTTTTTPKKANEKDWSAAWHSHSTYWAIRLFMQYFLFDDRSTFEAMVFRDWRSTDSNLARRNSWVEWLRNSSRVIAIVYVLFFPVIVTFVALYALIKLVQIVRSDATLLLSRHFSLRAQLSIRRYNELPHCLAERLQSARDAAESFLKLYDYYQYPSLLQQCLMPVGAFILATILTFCLIQGIYGFVDDSSNFFGLSLLSWTTITTALLLLFARQSSLMINSKTSALHPLSRAKSLADLQIEINQSFERYIKLTRGDNVFEQQPTWSAANNPYWQYQLIDAEFCTLPRLIWNECLALIWLVPFLFAFTIPHNNKRWVDFLVDHTVPMPGIGLVCRYGDFNQYLQTIHNNKLDNNESDPNHFSNSRHPATIIPSGREETLVTVLQEKELISTQKLEWSVSSFMWQHPTWAMPEPPSHLHETPLSTTTTTTNEMKMEQDDAEDVEIPLLKNNQKYSSNDTLTLSIT